MWQPNPSALRPPGLNAEQRALTEQEKKQKHEQHLRDLELYLASNGSNGSSADSRERPLTHEERQKKYEQHLAEYMAIPPAHDEKDESLLLSPEEKFKRHLAEYSSLYPNSEANPAATPHVPTLNLSQQSPAPASSSYSSIMPVLRVERDARQFTSADSDITEEELAQIRAIEEQSRAITKPAAALQKKLIGRDICRIEIQPEQQKDYDKLKEIWLNENDKSLIRKILAVLNYYTCGDSLLKPLITLGRKNLTDVEPIINHINEIQKSGISIDDSSNELTNQVMEGLYNIPLTNHKGTLATVIQFLTEQMGPIQEKQNSYTF